MKFSMFRTQPSCSVPGCDNPSSHGIEVVTGCCANPIFKGKICEADAGRFTVQRSASNVKQCPRCGALSPPKVKAIERL